jgi:DNA-binding NarL/FixJ family response regulator
MNDIIRILLAEDHAMVRRGVRALLNKVNGITVVGEAIDGREAIILAEQLKPDIVIMDISMPRKNGFEAAAEIQRKLKSTQILFLTMHNSASLARQALRLGARGYVLKRQAVEELIPAIQSLSAGETYLSPALEIDGPQTK